MSRNELIAKIEALNEWEAVIEEAKAEAEAIRDSIKQEMLERDTEELTAGQYIVRWTSVLSNRFDTTAFKKTYGFRYYRERDTQRNRDYTAAAHVQHKKVYLPLLRQLCPGNQGRTYCLSGLRGTDGIGWITGKGGEKSPPRTKTTVVVICIKSGGFTTVFPHNTSTKRNARFFHDRGSRK